MAKIKEEYSVSKQWRQIYGLAVILGQCMSWRELTANMAAWLSNEAEQDFSPDLSYQPTQREIKHRWAMKLERLLGVELSKKHFTLVK